jgi:hypothetical protein
MVSPMSSFDAERRPDPELALRQQCVEEAVADTVTCLANV